MKHTHLLLFGLLMLLLAACRLVESHPTNIAVVSATAPATRTPFLMVTSTPLPSVVKSTSTRRSTSTPIPTPTETPYIPPSPLPPVPLPDPSAQYILSTPDPNQLVVVADMVTQKRSEIYRNWLDETELDNPFASYFPDESKAVLDLVAYDLWHYHPNGFPGVNVETAINSKHLQWGIGLSGWLENYLIGYAIYNLNQEKIVFQAGLNVTVNDVIYLPHSIELDSDSESEWLIEVLVVRQEDYQSPLKTWLLLDKNTDGIYAALPNDIPITLGDTEFYDELLFDFSHDINGDSIPDVVISYMTYFGGTLSGSFLVYMWNGNNLALVGRGGLPGVNPRFGETNRSTYEISDFDKDGRDEVRVTWPRFAEAGCTWQTLTTYNWNGKELVETVENEDVPVELGMVGCYITKAMWSDQPEDKTYWSEMAYKALSPDVSTDLRAWVLLRLMAAYLGENRNQEAEQAVQQLASLTDEGNFLIAIQDAITITDGSPLEVCRVMYERASEGEENHRIFGSAIDDYLQYGGYPLSYDPDPRKVCPYSALAFDNMQNVRVSANIPPVEAYAELGFMLEVAQAANVDLDPEDEWVAVYQEDLFFFDAVSGKWRAELVRQINDTPAAIHFGLADVTGDQVSDLLIMITGSEPHYQAFSTGPDPVLCKKGQISYIFIIVDVTTTNYQRVDQRYISCRSTPLPNLTTIDGVSEFRYPFSIYSDSRADWPQWRFMSGMPDRPATYQNVYEYIDEIQGNILSGVDLDASRQALQALIIYIPPEDTEAAFIVPRLQYLLGLSYEIESRADEAMDVYLALIQSAPQSAWSWLAWTRLTGVATRSASTPG